MYNEFNIYEIDSKYQVPVFYIQGTNDYITPTDMVIEYYETISAPRKNLYTIQDCGHTPFLDNPEVFAKYVKEALDSIC